MFSDTDTFESAYKWKPNGTLSVEREFYSCGFYRFTCLFKIKETEEERETLSLWDHIHIYHKEHVLKETILENVTNRRSLDTEATEYIAKGFTFDLFWDDFTYMNKPNGYTVTPHVKFDITVTIRCDAPHIKQLDVYVH